MPPLSSARIPNWHVCVWLAISLFLVATLPAQTETTASLGGVIFAGDRKAAVSGAHIGLRHAATGDAFVARANSAGQYLFIGLRPGERYTMRVTAPGHDPEEIRDIVLALGEERQLDVALADPAKATVHMETLVVTARREHSQPGTTTALTQREIEERPSIDQTVNDYATSDPRVTMLGDDYNEGAIAAAGQHHLFNSLQIDGIRLDDGFGLSANGLPAIGNPFAMETIQAVSVDLAPYDVSRGGFTGASINAVTKSGSNRLSGSFYYTYANEKFKAAHPVTGKRTPYTDETYGFTLGGPILKNRLFFFVSWERTAHTDPAKETGFEPSADALERIAAIARDKYGFDAGVLADSTARSRKNDRYMAKLDWRINASHRLSARYTASGGEEPAFPDYSSASESSLSSHWYTKSRDLKAWSAQASSKWSDGFQTEASFAHQRYVNNRIPYARLPQIRIGKVPAADDGDPKVLYLGAEYGSQMNDLTTQKTQAKLAATWLLGRHRIQFGGEYSRDDYDNKYMRYAWAHYAFASIDDFENEKFSGYTYNYTFNGKPPGIKWGYAVNTAFLQDTWRVSRSLTLTAGARLEYPAMGERPAYNHEVAQTFGRRNDHTIDGAWTLGPRASFAWTPLRDRKIQVRGGLGVFQGRPPGVWLANAFTYDGISLIETSGIPDDLHFSIDINNQMPGKNTGTNKTVVMMDKNLRLPAIMRGNLAVDFRLPWQGMTATVEWLFSRAEKSLVYRNINFVEPFDGPDGRPLYGAWTISSAGAITHTTRSQYQQNNYEDVYLLTNAGHDNDDSRASFLTFGVSRPVKNHWGATLAYTRGHATEVSYFTNSTASANFHNRVSTDPNSDETGVSSSEIRDRVIASLTTRFALVRKFNTTIQLIYDGYSGRPYSYTFRNDANGDGQSGNDLFYVPAGPNDPALYWASQADKDLFFAYLAADPSLQRYAGRIVPRNSERSKFRHRLDLRLSQEIPFWRSLRGELFANFLNFTNLLNAKWGAVYQYGSPYNKGIAYGYYDPDMHAYRYSMTNTSGNLVTPPAQTLQSSVSRWRIQVGAKVKF